MLSSVCQVAHLNEKQASMWTWHMAASPSFCMFCIVLSCSKPGGFMLISEEETWEPWPKSMHTVHKPKDRSAPAKFGNAGCHGCISNPIEPAHSIWKTLLALEKLHLKSTTRGASTHSHVIIYCIPLYRLIPVLSFSYLYTWNLHCILLGLCKMPRHLHQGWSMFKFRLPWHRCLTCALGPLGS